jgi:hypothetical protein
MRTNLTKFLVLTAALAACGDDYDDAVTPTPPAPPAFTVVEASGAIAAKVAEFRTLLGDPRNGGTVGPSATGRREIGWDGVPAEFNNGDARFPAAFFNSNVRLGVVMTTLGTGFRNDSSLFADINPTYPTQFGAFSPNKIFAPSSGHIFDIHFQLAGQPTPGLVSGLGVVFSDVDVASTTTMEFFDRDGKSLGKAFVPIRSDAAGLSFLGVKFGSAIVSRVRITLGTGALGAGINDVSNGGQRDLVVMDDFIYGEPQPQL